MSYAKLAIFFCFALPNFVSAAITTLFLGNQRIGTPSSYIEIERCLTTSSVLVYYESIESFENNFVDITGRAVPAFDYPSSQWEPIDASNRSSFPFLFVENNSLDALYSYFDIYAYDNSTSNWQVNSRWIYYPNHGFKLWNEEGSPALQFPIIQNDIPPPPPSVLIPGDVIYTIPEPSTNIFLWLCGAVAFFYAAHTKRRL